MSTSANTNKKVFLATTAIEEFWDTSQPTVFLGSWCVLYKKNPSSNLHLKEYISSPYQPKEEDDIYIYIFSVYNRILPIIVNALNSLHGKKHSVNYWRIIIGPWLLFYLHIIYDRLSYLTKAIDNYPKLTTILLSEKSYTTPLDTLHFMCSASEDLYNLQIFSKIFKFMGKTFLCKEYNSSEISDYEKTLKTSYKTKFSRILEVLYEKIISFLIQKPIYCNASYLSKMAIFKLIIKSFGKIVFFRNFTTIKHDKQYDKKDREVFSGLNFGDCLFSKCLSCLLHSDIPKSFIENFDDINDIVKSKYPKNPGLIASSNAWYCNEPFKFWAANHSENGIGLVGFQYGGADYGAREHFLFRDYEMSIVDYYFSWGWKDSKGNTEVIPMPANKLVEKKILLSTGLEADILWGMTSMPRYLIYFPRITSYFERYLDFQIQFLNSLDANCIKSLRVRPHYQDHGWKIQIRLTDTSPQLRLDSLENSFTKSLEDCKLYVCDHLSTTLLEAIALNKPTILFWDKDINQLKEEYKHYFDSLEAVGVLHYSPESAAITVNNIHNNVDLWWNEKERQKAVCLFKNKFVQMSSNSVDVWHSELINLLNNK